MKDKNKSTFYVGRDIGTTPTPMKPAPSTNPPTDRTIRERSETPKPSGDAVHGQKLNRENPPRGGSGVALSNMEHKLSIENNFENFEEVFEGLRYFLQEKNKKYGNSALEPLGIFSKHIGKENSMAVNGILARLDDKLKRIKNADELRKNDVADIIGYLIILCRGKGWKDFTDLLD